MYKHTHKKDIENVMILQGGGSLGAFACGVCKTFEKKEIKNSSTLFKHKIPVINRPQRKTRS